MDALGTEKVLDDVAKTIRQHEAKIAGNLEWLKSAMHPFFFSFNQDESDALAVLVSALNRIHRLPYLRLTDRPERLLLAQPSYQNSLYTTLNTINRHENLSYAEINTSLQTLPDSDQLLEVLRFDYARKPDQAIAEQLQQDAGSDLPADIIQQVEAEIDAHLPEFDKTELEALLKLLWINNPDYVRVSHPERLARVMHLYQQTEQHGGIHLAIQPIDDAANGETARILFGVSNPPQYDYLLQVLEVFKRLNIGVKRAYVVKMSNGVYPSFLATFYVKPRKTDQQLEPGSELLRNLQHELYNTQILSSYSSSFQNLVESGAMNGPDASLVRAFITFAHTNLAHNNPERFDPVGIQRAFHNHHDVSTQLVQLFHARFKPDLEDRELVYSTLLDQAREMVDNFIPAGASWMKPDASFSAAPSVSSPTV
ncbi:MAG: NAD-glutamate dehydrogenase [Thiolinea sp.]